MKRFLQKVGEEGSEREGGRQREREKGRGREREGEEEQEMEGIRDCLIENLVKEK